MRLRKRDDGSQLRVESLDAAQVDIGEAFRGQLPALDPSREARNRRVRDVGVARRQRRPVIVCTHEHVAGGSRSAGHGSHGNNEGWVPTGWRAGPAHRARPCAVRRAVREAAPSTAASSLPRGCARRRSSTPARASRLRRTWLRSPAAPTSGRFRKSGAHRASPPTEPERAASPLIVVRCRRRRRRRRRVAR